jgi:hypothetical protein
MSRDHENQEAARALADDILKVWPTASLFDWDNKSGPDANMLIDAEGNDLLPDMEDAEKLQDIVDRHARGLGWHEADPEAAYFFSVAEARTVSDGDDGVFVPGFKHANWEFLEQD